MAIFSFSCQGSLEYFGEYTQEEIEAQRRDFGNDAGLNTDLATSDATYNMDAEDGTNDDMSNKDMGSESDVVVEPEPDPEPEPEPTTDAPQVGPSVNSLVANSCSTISVKGLSTQLIDQMNCEVPGIMKSFAGSNAVTYSAVVFPFMQGPATDQLILSGNSKTADIPVNSALRTIAQQYLLYAWYRNNPRLCNANLAAAPGNSNHNGGAAVDIGSNATWRTSLRSRGFVDNVSGEPWHFKFSDSVDVRSLSILAFQKLYNRNFPTKKIDEDGAYGPNTASALASSPGEGFAREPVCEATQSFIAYSGDIPMDVDWVTDSEGRVELRVIATGGIRNIEIFSNGQKVAEANQDGEKTLRTSFQVNQDFTSVDIEIRGYDVSGLLRGKELAQVNTQPDGVFRRPLGDGVFEIGRTTGATNLDFDLSALDEYFSTKRGILFRQK